MRSLAYHQDVHPMGDPTCSAGLDCVHERDAGGAALEPGQVAVEHALHVRVAVPVQRGVATKCPQHGDCVPAHHRGDTGRVCVGAYEGRSMGRSEQLHAQRKARDHRFAGPDASQDISYCQRSLHCCHVLVHHRGSSGHVCFAAHKACPQGSWNSCMHCSDLENLPWFQLKAHQAALKARSCKYSRLRRCDRAHLCQQRPEVCGPPSSWTVMPC